MMFAAKTARTACMLVALSAFAGGAQAATYTFNTSDSPFTTGIDNQGYWSPSSVNYDTNADYSVGYSGNSALRNFFTFNLASLNLSNQQIVSATLELRRMSYNSTDASETVQFFDVSTAPAVLNYNVGTSQAIFDDLGSGKSYGSAVVTQAGSTAGTVLLTLTSAALGDIAVAAGGYFSIGGSCPTCTGPSQSVFRVSNSTGIQQLVVQTAPVPEPSTYAMLGIGLAALAFLRRRKTA